MVERRRSKEAVPQGEYYNNTREMPDDMELHDLDPQSDDPDEFLASSSDESDDTFRLYTPDEERHVVRLLDTRLVLFLAFLYLLSFLDRSNIGNAKVAGMSQDLGLSSAQFEWLLTGFYIMYIGFEWMTLLYKIFPAHAYISICVAAWGFLASLQSLSTGFKSMLTCRLFLGISEAAFGPGVPFYLSFFYRRDELAFRTGLFISAAPLASSFASSLAYGIVKFGSHTSIESWRLLFLIEGFPSCMVAIWAWYWIPDSPETAPWLRARERKIAALRLRKERTVPSSTPEKHELATVGKRRLNWQEMAKTLRDPISFLAAVIFFSCNVAFSSMPVFAPVIIQNMGYSAIAAQGLSAPPNLFAFIIVLATAALSDRYKSRSVPIMIHASIAMLGYILLASAHKLGLPSILQYLCLFPITAGFFSTVTTVIVWTVNNQKSDEGRGSGVALLNVIGQLGPLLGTRLYPDKDAPDYSRGHAVCAGFMAAVVVLAVVLRVLLGRANAAARNARLASQEDESDQPLVGVASLLDDGFEYIL